MDAAEHVAGSEVAKEPKRWNTMVVVLTGWALTSVMDHSPNSGFQAVGYVWLATLNWTVSIIIGMAMLSTGALMLIQANPDIKVPAMAAAAILVMLIFAPSAWNSMSYIGSSSLTNVLPMQVMMDSTVLLMLGVIVLTGCIIDTPWYMECILGAKHDPPAVVVHASPITL